MNLSNHKIWIKSLPFGIYSIVITYKGNTTKETIATTVEAVREKVHAFKVLYDNDFEVLSDFNYT